jgi:hypothetical protein
MIENSNSNDVDMEKECTTRNRRIRTKWLYSDITGASKKGVEVALTNKLFQNDETCDESMYFLIFHSICRILIPTLPNYAEIANPWPKGELAKKTRRSPKITLVLDLDETLIHSEFSSVTQCDFSFKLDEDDVKLIVNNHLDLCKFKALRGDFSKRSS